MFRINVVQIAAQHHGPVTEHLSYSVFVYSTDPVLDSVTERQHGFIQPLPGVMQYASMQLHHWLSIPVVDPTVVPGSYSSVHIGTNSSVYDDDIINSIREYDTGNRMVQEWQCVSWIVLRSHPQSQRPKFDPPKRAIPIGHNIAIPSYICEENQPLRSFPNNIALFSVEF